MILTGILFCMNPFVWIGWIFAPHITVAFIATAYYCDTNPFLVTISWLVGIFGTLLEWIALDSDLGTQTEHEATPCL